MVGGSVESSMEMIWGTVIELPDTTGQAQPSRRKEEHGRGPEMRKKQDNQEPGCSEHKVCEQKNEK